MASNPDQTQPRVATVKAAIAILRHLAEAREAQGVNAIARAMSLSPSSCFNLLKTLADERFVDFDDSSKLYSLGPGVVAMARRALDSNGVYGLLQPKLEEFADRHGVSAGIYQLRRNDRLHLMGYCASHSTTRILMAVGQRMPLAGGASGRCALAFSRLSKEEQLAKFRAVKWAEAPSERAYLAQVVKAKADGWAVDIDNYVRGITTVATPILDQNGNFAYSVAAVAFSGQFDADELQALSHHLRKLSNWISARLGLSS